MLQVVRLRLFCIAILLVTLTVEGWVLNNGNSMSSTRTSQPSFKIQHVSSSRRKSRGRVSLLSLQAANNDKKGYKFGDFTKAIGRKVTGDDDYKFGDISRKLDKAAKDRVTSLTGQTKDYEFGDLSRWADSVAKERAANFTGKANYQVGDLSKEVSRRVLSGEYELEDVILAFRVMLQMGVSFLPIARFLPVKVLLEVLNVGLAQDVGGKVMGGVAKSLDERFKAAITGDAKYKMGDMTKKQLSDALSKFTGQDSYTFGDISRTVAARVDEMESTNQGKNGQDSKVKNAATQESALVLLKELESNDALAEWDKKLVEERKERKDSPTKS